MENGHGALSRGEQIRRHFVLQPFFGDFLEAAHQGTNRRKNPKKYPTPLSEVSSYFASHGFELVRDFSRLNFLHTLHIALYRRKQGSLPRQQRDC